jgi:hypothetical protein
MESYISQAPVWAIVLFVIGFIGSIFLIARSVQKAALHSGMEAKKSRRIFLGILLFYLLWLAYVSVLALNGVLYNAALPPRIFLFTTIPLLVILFGFVGNTALFKKLLGVMPLESMVFMHVFRILGVFFLLLSFYKLLEPGFAMAAGMGDIITAILAIPVARAVALKKPWSTPLVYAWNIFGLLDIVNLMTIAIFNAIKHPGTGGEMVLFPFSWFPAFAPASIPFFHYAIFRKLKAGQVSTRHVVSPGLQ